MNERIRELMIQTMVETGKLEDVQATYQRFAELIVQECADIASINQHQYNAVGDYVLKHFGVEE